MAAVAAEFGVGWGTVMTAVRDYGAPLVDDPNRLDGCTPLGVDETAFLAATPPAGTRVRHRHRGLERPPAAARRGRPVAAQTPYPAWVSGRDQAWRDNIAVAALDPFRRLRHRAAHHPAARRPGAGRVPRRPARLRRRGPGPPPGAARDHRAPRPPRRPAVSGSAGCCAAASSTTPERSWDRLLAGLDAGDVDQQIGRAWIAAQELRLLYREPDRTDAERRLLRWFTDVAEHEIPELLRLARTLDAWREELLAYFDTGGVSNGPTEAINGLIKKIKRIGHGYRNFANYRLRLLLHCGVDLAHSSRHPDPRAATTLSCVEPSWLGPALARIGSGADEMLSVSGCPPVVRCGSHLCPR